jgi:predicted acylesterase/phospholipase RssA
MLERIDPFRLKQLFDWGNLLVEELGDLGQDLRFLRALRRAFLPLPYVERQRPVDTAIFPPLQVRPHPRLAGKRVGLVASGGSGATVALCGVKRALEEADVQVAAISVCSGSAIWGALLAAGLSAQEMVDCSMRWRPVELVEVDLAALARIPFTAARGFLGIVSADGLERTLLRDTRGLTVGRAPIPAYAIVLNMDKNEVGYFGPHNQPEMPLARMARVAMALPLFVHPVRVGEHYYVDGGAADIFPITPLLRYERPFDHLIGMNVIMPAGFRGEDVSGWLDRPGAILRTSRQLYHLHWLELARRQLEQVGDRFTLLEPLPYSEIYGSKFFEVFVDNRAWPEIILKAYAHTRERLAALR